MEVRVQSIVVEFILTHVEQLFGDAPLRGTSRPGGSARGSRPDPDARPRGPQAASARAGPCCWVRGGRGPGSPRRTTSPPRSARAMGPPRSGPTTPSSSSATTGRTRRGPRQRREHACAVHVGRGARVSVHAPAWARALLHACTGSCACPKAPRVLTHTHKRAQPCPGVRRRAQPCAGVYRRVQACPAVHRRVQACSAVLSRAQACPAVLSRAQPCPGVRRRAGSADARVPQEEGLPQGQEVEIHLQPGPLQPRGQAQAGEGGGERWGAPAPRGTPALGDDMSPRPQAPPLPLPCSSPHR